MANWYYYEGGVKKGPVDSAALMTLAKHKVINPKTPIETESGRKSVAGKIQGLVFGSSRPAIAKKVDSAQPSSEEETADPISDIFRFEQPFPVVADSITYQPSPRISQEEPTENVVLPVIVSAFQRFTVLITISIAFILFISIGWILIDGMLEGLKRQEAEEKQKIADAQQRDAKAKQKIADAKAALEKAEKERRKSITVHIETEDDLRPTHAAVYEVWVNGEKADEITTKLAKSSIIIKVPTGDIEIQGRVKLKNEYGAVMNEGRATVHKTVTADDEIKEINLKVGEYTF